MLAKKTANTFKWNTHSRKPNTRLKKNNTNFVWKCIHTWQFNGLAEIKAMFCCFVDWMAISRASKACPIAQLHFPLRQLFYPNQNYKKREFGTMANDFLKRNTRIITKEISRNDLCWRWCSSCSTRSYVIWNRGRWCIWLQRNMNSKKNKKPKSH